MSFLYMMGLPFLLTQRLARHFRKFSTAERANGESVWTWTCTSLPTPEVKFKYNVIDETSFYSSIEPALWCTENHDFEGNVRKRLNTIRKTNDNQNSDISLTQITELRLNYTTFFVKGFEAEENSQKPGALNGAISHDLETL